MSRIASGRLAVVGVVTLCLMSHLALGACSGSDIGPETGALDAPDNKHLSLAERQLRDTVRKDRQLEGAVTGCVAGGLLGGVFKAVTGGSTKDVVTTAAVGCVVGGVIGAAWGSYVDARAQQYANQQEQIAKLTAAAREDVVRYQRVNAALRKLIDEERARITKAGDTKAKVKQAVAKKEETVAERATTIRQLEAKLVEIDDNIKTIEADQAELSKKGVDTAALNAPKQGLRTERAQLNTGIGTLKQLSGRS
jgi:DNA repair exonuclease SbcCD ATPase subunit